MKKIIRKRTKERIETDNRIGRRLEIYSKALDLFLTKGYDATSLTMIAKRLGMSKANLYYYFPSKQGLLYQIHLDILQRLFIPILDEVDKIDNHRERLIQFLQRFTFKCTQSPSSRLLIHEV